MKILNVFILVSFVWINTVQAQSLFLLAGQSNACGLGKNAQSNLLLCPKAFEYNVLTDSVQPLRDPAGQQWLQLEPAKTGSILPAFTATFAQLSGKNVYVLTAARGGASCSNKAELALFDTWDVSGKIWQNCIDKTNKAIAKTGLPLKGVIWMQGERDANAINDGKATADDYLMALMQLIQRFRDVYGNDLPFFIVHTGYQSGRPITGNDAVRAIQKQVCATIPNVHLVYENTHLFEEKKWMHDFVHYNQEGLNDIGTTIAAKMHEVLKEN